jgi:uncharacterized protein (DUF305 family)
MKYVSGLAAVVLLGLVTAVYAQHSGHGSHGHGRDAAPTPGASAPAAETPASKAYRTANDKMHAAMNIAFSGNADVDFLRGMIPHHQGAIDMAKVVLQHGKDARVRKLAEEIIRAQELEIAEMRKWLEELGR